MKKHLTALKEKERNKNNSLHRFRSIRFRLIQIFILQTIKPIQLDLISSHKVDLPNIWSMTVMRETGRIVVSTWDSYLLQLSHQKGSITIRKDIKLPCEHIFLYLLCLQVAGREYLALSCGDCKNIKLMNINKQRPSSDSQIEYEVITAFSGEEVYRMCHGEENRLFVLLGNDTVLELDTSTKTFIKVKTIDIRDGPFSYVPEPHRLIVVSDKNETCAVSCDDNKVVWKLQKDEGFDPGHSRYTPSHKVLLVADWSKNKVVVLEPGTGLLIQSITLPDDDVCKIRGLCLFNDQVIIGSSKMKYGTEHISHFSLK